VLPRYFLHEESPLWVQIAAEAFRDSTFGMIDVRILESGRLVVGGKEGLFCFPCELLLRSVMQLEVRGMLPQFA
jgi:hypothetical protein